MKLQEKIQGVIDFQKDYENPDDEFNWLEFAQDYAEHYHTQQLAIDSVSNSLTCEWCNKPATIHFHGHIACEDHENYC